MADNQPPNLNGLANENEIVLRISLSTGSFAASLQELENRFRSAGAGNDAGADNVQSYYCTVNKKASAVEDGSG
jgi:hypothetical protein